MLIRIKVKGQNKRISAFLISKSQFDNAESENHGPIFRGPILTAQGPKNLKWVKISKSLFHDFLIGIHQIDLEESENHSPSAYRAGFSTLRSYFFSIFSVPDRKV